MTSSRSISRALLTINLTIAPILKPCTILYSLEASILRVTLLYFVDN
jgi:hypothetical protein